MKAPRRLYNAFLIPGNAIQVLLFLVPLGAVVLFSFGTTNVVGLPQVGFTWANYQEVFESYYVPVLLRTIAFAGATTVICLLLGYPLAYFTARFAKRWGPAIIAAIMSRAERVFSVETTAETLIRASSSSFSSRCQHRVRS